MNTSKLARKRFTVSRCSLDAPFPNLKQGHQGKTISSETKTAGHALPNCSCTCKRWDLDSALFEKANVKMIFKLLFTLIQTQFIVFCIRHVITKSDAEGT